jgi:GAF domain-containing protein
MDAAGILLANREGGLGLAATTSEDAQLLDLFQVQQDAGPGLECYHTGSAVAVKNLAEAGTRWPLFAQEAIGHGFTSAVALPMRLRKDVIGVLTLLAAAGTAPVSRPQARVARALANAATIAILQQRLSEDRRVLNEQLQMALDSRVAVEQGKGVLVTRLQVSADEAFQMLRRRARATRRQLSEVAEEVRRRGPGTNWDDYRNPTPRDISHNGDRPACEDRTIP